MKKLRLTASTFLLRFAMNGKVDLLPIPARSQRTRPRGVKKAQ